jgi:site-specific DNA recombinase
MALSQKYQSSLNQSKNYKIGIYIRVSTEEQAENPEGSIRSQEERLRAAIKYKNMEGGFGEITGVFVDARSGKNTKRPELQRLLDAIRSREVNFVLVTELSRLSRSIKDFCEMWDMMKAYGCGFMSLRESFDTSTAAGEMVLFSIANIAQFERKQISERVVANFNSRASRGLFNGGKILLGYDSDPDNRGRLLVNESEAKIVKAAFHAFIQEGSLMAAAKWLNQKNYRVRKSKKGSARHGGFFTIDNLHYLLTRKSYTGVRVYQGRNGASLETQAAWSAIIDPDTFNRVQTRLAENRGRHRTFNRERYSFVLSGRLVCSICGNALCGKTANGNGGKIPYYEHGWATKRMSCMVKDVYHCDPHRVLAKLIEPQIWQEIWRVMITPKLASDLIKEARKTHASRSTEDKQGELRRRLKTLETQLENVAERISDLPKDVSGAALYKQMQKMETLKIAAQQELSELQADSGPQDFPAELKSYEAFVNALKTEMDSPLGNDISSDHVASREACRKVIRLLVQKIEITPRSFRIFYHCGEKKIQSSILELSANSAKQKEKPGSWETQKPGSYNLTNGWGTRIRT